MLRDRLARDLSDWKENRRASPLELLVAELGLRVMSVTVLSAAFVVSRGRRTGFGLDSGSMAACLRSRGRSGGVRSLGGSCDEGMRAPLVQKIPESCRGGRPTVTATRQRSDN